MNLNQLIYANEINRLGSFSRAAQTLYISQSALSKSIHALELELEQEIFIRTPEGIAATDFGREFLAESEKILQHVGRIRQMAARKADSGSQPLRFSASCGQMLFASEIFARLLARYLDRETDFQFYQKSYSEVFSDVRDGRCDLGILMMLNLYTEEACELFEQNDLEYQSLGRLNVGVAVDHTNPVNELGLTRLRKTHLEEQTLLLIKEAMYPFSREEQELRNAFDNPKTVYVGDNDTAISLSRQLPAYFCVAQSAKIYNKLNIPLSIRIYPCQNVNLKYEFGWIRKKQTELTGVEKLFISEIGKLFH